MFTLILCLKLQLGNIRYLSSLHVPVLIFEINAAKKLVLRTNILGELSLLVVGGGAVSRCKAPQCMGVRD